MEASLDSKEATIFRLLERQKIHGVLAESTFYKTGTLRR
jgi:hypothetical protein